MYEARYWGIVSAHTILNVQAGFIHVICLGISNKSVAVPRQDSIRPYSALSGHCNIYTHTYNECNTELVERIQHSTTHIERQYCTSYKCSALMARECECEISG